MKPTPIGDAETALEGAVGEVTLVDPINVVLFPFLVYHCIF